MAKKQEQKQDARGLSLDFLVLYEVSMHLADIDQLIAIATSRGGVAPTLKTAQDFLFRIKMVYYLVRQIKRKYEKDHDSPEWQLAELIEKELWPFLAKFYYGFNTGRFEFTAIQTAIQKQTEDIRKKIEAKMHEVILAIGTDPQLEKDYNFETLTKLIEEGQSSFSGGIPMPQLKNEGIVLPPGSKSSA